MRKLANARLLSFVECLVYCYDVIIRCACLCLSLVLRCASYNCSFCGLFVFDVFLAVAFDLFGVAGRFHHYFFGLPLCRLILSDVINCSESRDDSRVLDFLLESLCVFGSLLIGCLFWRFLILPPLRMIWSVSCMTIWAIIKFSSYVLSGLASSEGLRDIIVC